jgi:hypothetical protein
VYGKAGNKWTGNRYFVNEKVARKHDMDRPNVLVRIHKDGSILYSVRWDVFKHLILTHLKIKNLHSSFMIASQNLFQFKLSRQVSVKDLKKQSSNRR